MNTETFIEMVKPLLHQHGFKKMGKTWRKDQGESVAVFNVQKSQWDEDTFYVNIGTYFRALGEDSSPLENRCHVQFQLAIDNPASVVAVALDWFKARENIQDATILAEDDSTKGLVFKELINFKTA